VARGAVAADGEALRAGAGAAVTDAAGRAVRATAADTEVLLFDLP
jgi:hypothetical protein